MKNKQNREEEIELTTEMLERNDVIDNTVYDCICTLAEKEIDWDMSIIGEVTDVIKDTLLKFNIKVRHPSVVTEKDGTQHYSDD